MVQITDRPINKYFYMVAIAALLFIPSAFSQQPILHQMQYEDISETRELKGLIVRDAEEALLVIKSDIATLSFKSNNLILRTQQKGAGEWYLFLRPGTHVISFQATGFQRLEKRIFLKSKAVAGMRITGGDAAQGTRRDLGLVVISTTNEAEIYVNDEFEGRGQARKSLPAGEHIVEARKDGYTSDSLRVYVSAGETEYVFLNPQLIPTIDHPTNIDNVESGGSKKWLFIGGAGLAAAGGIVFLLSQGGGSGNGDDGGGGNGGTNGTVLPWPPDLP